MTNPASSHEPDFKAIADMIYPPEKFVVPTSKVVRTDASDVLNKLRANPEALAAFLQGSGYVSEAALKLAVEISYSKGKEAIKTMTDAALGILNNKLLEQQLALANQRVKELEIVLGGKGGLIEKGRNYLNGIQKTEFIRSLDHAERFLEKKEAAK